MNKETKQTQSHHPNAVLVSSSAYFEQLPKPHGDEFAIMGRSNVGKSSFINHVLENHTLARVSKRPGKTTLANLYRIDGSTYWVDLPGYGYARAASGEKERWSGLIRTYCEKRSNLAGVVWLLDIRHPALAIDKEADSWLRSIGVPVLPVLTKADKLSKNERVKQERQFRDLFKFKKEPVSYSTLEHSSRERFWTRFTQWRQELLLVKHQ